MKTQNENSLAAWHKVKDSISETKRKILVVLGKRENATIAEIATELRHDYHALSGRFSELERDGLIEKAVNETGKKVRRPNHKGNLCGAYQLCKKPVSQPTLFDQ